MRLRPTLLILVTAASTHAADAPPSTDEVAKLFDDKQWPELAAATSKLLALRGTSAAGLDRYDLWMKKGEAQLQLNQSTPASQSFAKAADEPGLKPDQIDTAKAYAALAKKTVADGYKTPARQGPVRVFNVKDPSKRPEALAALLSVNAAELSQRLDAAKAVTEPRPLVQLAEQAVELGALDRVVNKSSEQSDAAQRRLAENVVATVKAWSDTTQAHIDDVNAKADEEVDQRTQDRTGQITIRKVRRGMQPRDLQDSMDLIGQSRKWAQTVTLIKAALGPVGQTALQPAEPLIQNVFDRAKSIQSDATRAKPNGQTPTPPTR